MQGSFKRNLDVFRKLCGDGALRHVVLCTTKWSEVDAEVGKKRTEQLKRDFWKEMIEHRSTVLALDSENSAWEVVNLIIESNREKMTALQHQEKKGFRFEQNQRK